MNMHQCKENFLSKNQFQMNGRLRKAMYQRNMACNEFRKYGKQLW